jgi:hypothetical protein
LKTAGKISNDLSGIEKNLEKDVNGLIKKEEKLEKDLGNTE